MIWVSPFAIAAENILKIGSMGPLKFGAGIGAAGGAEIAVEEINEKGGVSVKGVKYKIELVKADTNEYLSVTDAVSTMERLITVNKINFLIGAFRTEAALAQQEIMADYRTIFVGVQAAHPKLCERVAQNYSKYKYWFRASLNSVPMGEESCGGLGVIKRLLKEKVGIEKPRVALQFEKAVWADPIIEDARANFPKYGLEIIRVGRHSATATDLTAELTAIKAAGAHIIFSGGAGPAENTLGKQWGELKLPTVLHSIATPPQEKTHWAATGGGCKYQSTHNAIGRVEITAKTIPFYDKFEKRVNDFPTTGGPVSAYDGVYLIKEAIERAGSLNTDAVVEAMEKTDYLGALGRFVFQPRTHKWPHDFIWGPGYITYVNTQWGDGRMETVWPDGNDLWGDQKWKGLRYKGTIDYQLPPSLISYWKGRK